MAHNNDSVRNKLIGITSQGLMLKAIARNAGMDVNDLSRFKGGMDCLKESEVEVLSEYLDAVVIPQWNSATRELSPKPTNKRREINFDLLRELD